MNVYSIIYIVIFVAFLSTGCDNDSTTDFPSEIIQHANVSDSAFTILLDDAKLICMDYYTMEEKEEIDNIDFDESHVAPILAALQYVYLDTINSFSRDIKRLQVHALYREQLHQSIFTGDGLNGQIQLWEDFGFSENNKLNSLINQYQLELDSIGNERYIVFSRKGINHKALAKELNHFQFISKASSINSTGDGSQIEIIEFNSDFIHLIYSYGWGDCPSGCIHRHFWELGIYGSGFIELINETGDKLPKKEIVT